MNKPSGEWVFCWGIWYTWTAVDTLCPQTGVGTCSFSDCTDRETPPIVNYSTLRKIEADLPPKRVAVLGFSLIWCDVALAA